MAGQHRIAFDGGQAIEGSSVEVFEAVRRYVTDPAVTRLVLERVPEDRGRRDASTRLVGYPTGRPEQ